MSEQLQKQEELHKETLFSMKKQLAVANQQTQSLEAGTGAVKQELLRRLQNQEAAEKEVLALQHQKNKLKKDLVDAKAKGSIELQDNKRRAEEREAKLLFKMKQLGTRSKQGEAKAIELLRLQEQLRVKWQDELLTEREKLENKCEKLKKTCLQLKMGKEVGALLSTSSS